MFTSTFCYRGKVDLPDFSGIRVMMMPVVLGHQSSVPDSLDAYRPVLDRLFEMGGHRGEIGYLTIDEKRLRPGSTHRRKGLHVDLFARRVVRA